MILKDIMEWDPMLFGTCLYSVVNANYTSFIFNGVAVHILTKHTINSNYLSKIHK